MTQIARYTKRALALKKHFNIEVAHLSIFPLGSDLEIIESVLHELAHAFTMGFLQMPTRLPDALEATLARYSATTRDSLEIDTAFVTYQTMTKLVLAKSADQAKFAARCADALTHNRYQSRQYYVLDEMGVRENDTALQDAVSNLTSTMRESWRQVLAIYSLPDDSPS